MSLPRVGTGFDVHRLVPGRALMLGGLEVPAPLGLDGHSDGDCVVHAVCDALLGAAAMGDMGQHFPSSDPQWKGAASLRFLTEVRKLLESRRFAIGNIDVTVIAQAPALAPHLSGMRERLSECLGVDSSRICVKAKSTDGLGAVGRGEGIAAQATVLIEELG
jgi:2-C-methyl-D-erythritol 2,4-cyclodiphosphate synthase